MNYMILYRNSELDMNILISRVTTERYSLKVNGGAQIDY